MEALIALIIVIRYKAKHGQVEDDIISGTRIYGYIIITLSLLGSTGTLLFYQNYSITRIIASAISIVLDIIFLVILIRIKATAERLTRTEEKKWW